VEDRGALRRLATVPLPTGVITMNSVAAVPSCTPLEIVGIVLPVNSRQI
jgi:hypothetical protein